MIVDLSPCFDLNRTGVSIWKTSRGYQVSVRNVDGSYSVGIAEDLRQALNTALGIRTEDESFDDLL